MFFVVTGKGRTGALAVTCDSAAAALETAHAFLAEGASDVVITDSDGLQHAPSLFERLVVAAE
jgi:hypothetical protein